jgi:hypothetical protein
MIFKYFFDLFKKRSTVKKKIAHEPVCLQAAMGRESAF